MTEVKNQLNYFSKILERLYDNDFEEKIIKTRFWLVTLKIWFALIHLRSVGYICQQHHHKHWFLRLELQKMRIEPFIFLCKTSVSPLICKSDRRQKVSRATADPIGAFSNMFSKADVINKTSPLKKSYLCIWNGIIFLQLTGLGPFIAAKPILIYLYFKNVFLSRRSIFFKSLPLQTSGLTIDCNIFRMSTKIRIMRRSWYKNGTIGLSVW